MNRLEPRYNPDNDDANTCADCDSEISGDRVRCAACQQDRDESIEPETPAERAWRQAEAAAERAEIPEWGTK